MADAARIRHPLTKLPLKLQEHYGDTGRGYRASYLMALDGKLPGASQSDNGRWEFFEDKLPEIARSQGITIPPARPRRATREQVAA